MYPLCTSDGTTLRFRIHTRDKDLQKEKLCFERKDQNTKNPFTSDTLAKEEFVALIFWPDRGTIRNTQPQQIRLNCSNLCATIDCTEVYSSNTHDISVFKPSLGRTTNITTQQSAVCHSL